MECLFRSLSGKRYGRPSLRKIRSELNFSIAEKAYLLKDTFCEGSELEFLVRYVCVFFKFNRKYFVPISELFDFVPLEKSSRFSVFVLMTIP